MSLWKRPRSGPHPRERPVEKAIVPRYSSMFALLFIVFLIGTRGNLWSSSRAEKMREREREKVLTKKRK